MPSFYETTNILYLQYYSSNGTVDRMSKVSGDIFDIFVLIHYHFPDRVSHILHDEWLYA